MKKVIFYGAGGFIREHKDDFMEKYAPVCFVDSNSNLWGTLLFGIEILSLEQALEEEYEYIVPTVDPSRYLEITAYLSTKGIDSNRVLLPFNCKFMPGCYKIGQTFHAYNGQFSTCSLIDKDHDFISFGKLTNFSKDLDSYYKKCSDLINSIQSDDNPCEGCSLITEDLFICDDQYPSIQSICFNSGFKGDRCNLECSYCKVKSDLKANKYEVSLLEYIQSIYKVKKVNTMIFANGEPTIGKDFDKICELMFENQQKCIFYTNAVYYSEHLAKLGKLYLPTVLVSFDCGTTETYKKIKGVDSYDKVVKNLALYLRSGVHIILKFILIDNINDNQADIDGFIRLAIDLHAEVIISKDVYCETKSLTQEQLGYLQHMVTILTESNMKINLSPNTFLQADIDIFMPNH